VNDDSSGNGDSGVVALVVDGIIVNGSEMCSTVTYGGMACTLEEERKCLTLSFISTYVLAFSLSTHPTPLISFSRLKCIYFMHHAFSLYAPCFHMCNFFSLNPHTYLCTSIFYFPILPFYN